LLFPENNFPDIVKFENIAELTEQLKIIFQKSPLYDTQIEVKSDITSAKKSKRGDLFIEISQQINNSNYSLTAFIPQGLLKYIFSFETLKSPSELPGKKWILKGKIDFWKSGAKYIISVNSILPLGESEIEKKRKKILASLKLKNLLRVSENSLKGLEPIKKIAVISSPTAAGFGDFEKNINHAVNIPIVHLYPAPMQGAQTVPGIEKALRKILTSKIDYDVAVIIRGGGSKSDLMYFDDEKLGILIASFNKRIPILTGIGHEQDKTIPDYVSWKNYSTPTEVSRDITNQINEYNDNLKNLEHEIFYSFKIIQNNIEKIADKDSLDKIKMYLNNLLAREKEKVDSSFSKFDREINDILNESTKTLLQNKIFHTKSKIDVLTNSLENKFFDYIKNNSFYMDINIKNKENNITKSFQNLTVNSPFASFLNKGSIIKKDGKIIDSVNLLKKDDEVQIVLKDGQADSIIKKCETWES